MLEVNRGLWSSLGFVVLLLAGCSEPGVTGAEGETSVNAGRAEPGLNAPMTIAPTEDPAGQPDITEAASMAVDGEGLRFFAHQTGSASVLAFGMPGDDVVARLERLRGQAARGTNESCGAGPVQYANWADGLSVVLQDGRFVGWSLDQRAAGAIQTANGIGPGSLRSEVDEAFGSVGITQTSLGTEFAAGTVFGLIDGPTSTSRITDMWAGVSCVAR